MKVIIENFKCWERYEVEFRDGVNLVSGKSGAGKTSILDAIKFCLFGSSGKRIQKYKSTSCRVTIHYQHIVISRTRAPNRLVLTKNNQEYEDHSAQGIINDIFGSIFDEIGYVHQGTQTSFIRKSPQEKLEFFERLALENDEIDRLRTEIISRIRAQEKDYQEIGYQLRKSEDNLKDLILPNAPEKVNISKRENIDDVLIAHKKSLQKYENYMKGYNDKLVSLRHLDKNIDSRLSDNQQLTTKIAEYNDNLTNDEMLDINTLRDKLKQINREKKKVDKYRKYQHDKERYDKELERLTSRKEEIEKDLWKEYTKSDIKGNIKYYSDELIPEFKKILDCERENKNITISDDNQNKIEEINKQIQYVRQSRVVRICPKCSCNLVVTDCGLKCMENYIAPTTIYTEKQLLKLLSQEQRICDNNKISKNTLDKNKKIIDKFHTTYDIDCSLSEIENDLESFREYYNSQRYIEKELDKINSKLDHNTIISNFDINKIPDTPDENLIETEEQIREDIQITNNIESIRSQIRDLQKMIDRNNTFIKQETDEFLRKFHSRPKIDEIETKINTCSNKITGYQEKIDTFKIRLDKIEEYSNYLERKQEYDRIKNEVKNYKEKELSGRKHLVRLKTLKEKLKQAEGIAILNKINTINTILYKYLEIFFPDDVMNARLEPYKTNKKGVEKSELNINIDYKGMECDLFMLSGGEIQRLALSFNLALTEMMNIPLLMLDECTSNLDETTTNIITSTVTDKLSHNRIVIMIAHQIVCGNFENIVNL